MMSPIFPLSNFHYQNGILFCENYALPKLASQFGTPLYVYSHDTIATAYQQFTQGLGSLPHRICYAVKANSNLSLLKILAELGAYFDIVSGGELRRLQAAQIDSRRALFAGVGKTAEEIALALTLGIHCFNIESEAELALLEKIATHLQCQASFALRINPIIDAQTHPHIATARQDSKFGVELSEVLPLYQKSLKTQYLQPIGIACHLGSQITRVEPYEKALDILLNHVAKLKSVGIFLKHVDLGGGFGIPYKTTDQVPSIVAFMARLRAKMTDRDLCVYIEPGRALVGPAGALITRCLYIKSSQSTRFAIVDTGMHHLLRPALYNAEHPIVPIHTASATSHADYTIVGPICETADVLGKTIQLPPLAPGDLLAIGQAGAYGFSMSSHYNSHPRPAEVLVRDSQARLIRVRERESDLFAHELGLA